jgi:hypothetical protein
MKRRLIKQQTKADEGLEHTGNNIQSLITKILSEKKENGLIGNTFSTRAAEQVSQGVKQEAKKRVMEESNT